jgi:hypothetical protein
VYERLGQRAESLLSDDYIGENPSFCYVAHSLKARPLLPNPMKVHVQCVKRLLIAHHVDKCFWVDVFLLLLLFNLRSGTDLDFTKL